MKKKRDFTPEKYYVPYLDVNQYFQNLEAAFYATERLANEYDCGMHTGLEKWVSVGLIKTHWFRKEWRLDVGLNPFFFQNGEVFFRLSRGRYVNPPILLAPFMNWQRGDRIDIKHYSIEEIGDGDMLYRDMREVVESELVTGKAWDF